MTFVPPGECPERTLNPAQVPLPRSYRHAPTRLIGRPQPDGSDTCSGANGSSMSPQSNIVINIHPRGAHRTEPVPDHRDAILLWEHAHNPGTTPLHFKEETWSSDPPLDDVTAGLQALSGQGRGRQEKMAKPLAGEALCGVRDIHPA